MATAIFQVKDAHAVMQSLARQATGQKDITVTDTSSFVSAGTQTLEAGYENLYNALGVLIGRTIVNTKPYSGKFKLIGAKSSDAFENRIRKISFYARDPQATGMFNTDIATNLGAGLDDEDGAGSQWEQFPAMPVEQYFFSDFAWDKAHTEYPEQAKIAFQNETDFINFINGMLIEVQNDIESDLEARNRLVALDFIAGTKLMVDKGIIGAESYVNLTEEFNTEHGTTYTTQEILTEHTVAFEEFLVARFKIDSDRLENRTKQYHNPLTKTVNGVDYSVLRHTPKKSQKFLYYSPIFTQMKMALAEIFNPQMLEMPQGEGIQYWQAFTSPSEIDVTPALPDGEETEEVNLKLVLGVLFDEEAVMTNNKFTGMYATPLNARHVYSTMYWHYRFGVINDPTFSRIVYVMEDPETP